MRKMKIILGKIYNLVLFLVFMLDVKWVAFCKYSAFILFVILSIGFVSSASLSLGYDSQSISKGDTLKVSVNVKDAISLYGFQFNINYDSSKFKYKSVNEGSFLKSDGAQTFAVSPKTDSAGIVKNYAVTRVGASSGGLS